MLRICKSLILRNILQPRVLTTPSHEAGMKQSIEEKLGLPRKPKKPLTAYFRFLLKVRPVLLQKYPDAKVTEISKIAGEHWAKADPEVRKQLEDEFKRDLDEYSKQLEEYKKSLTDNQKQEIIDAKHAIKEKKEKLDLKKKVQEMGKPKKPPTPYLSYMLEHLSSKKEGERFHDYQKHIAKEWGNLEQKSKDVYLNNFAKQMESYKRELQEWEEKMIRLGHIDVVRNEALIETSENVFKKSRKVKPVK